MEDAREVAINKLSELLKHPDDLNSKVGPLTRKLAKEKASIDAQLNSGVQSQLDHVQEGLETLTISSRNINRVKENMRNIDKLCYDAQSMIKDFPRINMVIMFTGLLSLSSSSFINRYLKFIRILLQPKQKYKLFKNYTSNWMTWKTLLHLCKTTYFNLMNLYCMYIIIFTN